MDDQDEPTDHQPNRLHGFDSDSDSDDELDRALTHALTSPSTLSLLPPHLRSGAGTTTALAAAGTTAAVPPTAAGGGTLLPGPIAQAVSLATRSTSLALRLTSAAGGFGLEAARATTLSGLELGRGVVEGVLSRAGMDAAAAAAGGGGGRGGAGAGAGGVSRHEAAAEGLLERSLEGLHLAVTHAVFWTAAGFRVTGATLGAVTDLAQMTLSGVDQLFGSTESSRAIASIITLVRREFKDPAATGGKGETVGVADLLMAICALAYLQRWCRALMEEEDGRRGVEEVVWDVVVLSDGDRVDVHDESLYGVHAGSYNNNSNSNKDDGVRRALQTISTTDHRDGDDSSDDEDRLKQQLMRALPTDTSVTVTTETTTTKTITVDVTGHRPLVFSPPPGVEVLETKKLDSGSSGTKGMDIAVASSSSRGGTDHPKAPVTYRIVYRVRRNKLRSTTMEHEDAAGGDAGFLGGGGGVDRDEYNVDDDDNDDDDAVEELDDDDDDEQMPPPPLPPKPNPPTVAPRREGESPVGAKRMDSPRPSAIPLRRSTTNNTTENTNNNTANQKRQRMPASESSASSTASSIFPGRRASKPDISKPAGGASVVLPAAGPPDKKPSGGGGGFRKALKKGLLSREPSAQQQQQQMPPKPSARPAWNVHGSGSNSKSGARASSTAAVVAPPPLRETPGHALNRSGGGGGGNLHAAAAHVDSAFLIPRPTSRASYISVHERRRDSVVSQTDTWSIHSTVPAGGGGGGGGGVSGVARPVSPTAVFRASAASEQHRRAKSSSSAAAAPGNGKPKSPLPAAASAAGFYKHAPASDSQSSLILASSAFHPFQQPHPRPLAPGSPGFSPYGAPHALATLRRTGTASLVPERGDGGGGMNSAAASGQVVGEFHLLRNAARYMRFSSAAYGSHFLRFMGLVRPLPPPSLRTRTAAAGGASSGGGGDGGGVHGGGSKIKALAEKEHHREVRSFASHASLRDGAKAVLLSSFVDDATTTTTTGSPATAAPSTSGTSAAPASSDPTKTPTNTKKPPAKPGKKPPAGDALPLVHYVALDHESRAVVLACRGTLGFEDVLADLTCDYDDLAWPTPRAGGAHQQQQQQQQSSPSAATATPSKLYRVHKGIHASARRLLLGDDGRVLSTLARALADWPTYGLVLTGHSLGGAVTALLGVMLAEPSPSRGGGGFVTRGGRGGTWYDETRGAVLQHEVALPQGRPVHVFAYGPPATMCPELRRATRGLITSFVHGADLVPFLSLGSLHDLRAQALAFKRDGGVAGVGGGGGDGGGKKTEKSPDAPVPATTTTVAPPNPKALLRARLWASVRSGLAERWYSAVPPAATSGTDDALWRALRAMRAAADGRDAGPPRLVPPGEVFVLRSRAVLRRDAFVFAAPEKKEGRGEGEGAGAAAAGAQRNDALPLPKGAADRRGAMAARPARRIVCSYVKDVERHFGEIRFSAAMLTDHSPAKYEEALEGLRRGVGEWK